MATVCPRRHVASVVMTARAPLSARRCATASAPKPENSGRVMQPMPGAGHEGALRSAAASAGRSRRRRRPQAKTVQPGGQRSGFTIQFRVAAGLLAPSSPSQMTAGRSGACSSWRRHCAVDRDWRWRPGTSAGARCRRSGRASGSACGGSGTASQSARARQYHSGSAEARAARAA